MDLASNLLMATQKARERMQEQYDRQMEIARQKEEEVQYLCLYLMIGSFFLILFFLIEKTKETSRIA